jgi:hypothetical protein
MGVLTACSIVAAFVPLPAGAGDGPESIVGRDAPELAATVCL